MTIKGTFKNDKLVGTFIIDEPGVMNKTAQIAPNGQLVYVYEDADKLEALFDEKMANFNDFKETLKEKTREFDSFIASQREKFMVFYVKLEGYLTRQKMASEKQMAKIEGQLKNIKIEVNLNFKNILAQIKNQGFKVGPDLQKQLQPY